MHSGPPSPYSVGSNVSSASAFILSLRSQQSGVARIRAKWLKQASEHELFIRVVGTYVNNTVCLQESSTHSGYCRALHMHSCLGTGHAWCRELDLELVGPVAGAGSGGPLHRVYWQKHPKVAFNSKAPDSSVVVCGALIQPQHPGALESCDNSCSLAPKQSELMDNAQQTAF